MVSSANTPVNPRYSLVSGGLNQDWVVDKGSGGISRFVEYDKPPQAVVATGRLLVAEGLVLGRNVSSDNERIERYAVPNGARLLAFEAPLAPERETGYNDAQLVYDLGCLTSTIARVTGGCIVNPPAERSFALVDHVPAGEPHIFAVPGIERRLSAPILELSVRLDQQLSAFQTGFGQHVHRYSHEFIEGYKSVASESAL